MNEEENIDVTFDYDGENFIANLDGKELVGCQWIPHSKKIRYVLIFFHGLGAFVSINRSYYPEILKDGGVIFGTDHYGHGRSPGERGFSTKEMLHLEITFLLYRASILFPDAPVFIYAHSMGAAATISYVLTHIKESNAIEGVIVEAPWISDTDEIEKSIPHKIIGKLGKFILPSLVIDTGDGISRTSYPKEFIENYLKSKLPHDFITPRLYSSALEMRQISWDKMNNWPKRLPLLFMQGAKDVSLSVERNLIWCEKMRNILNDKIKVVFHKDAEHAMLRKASGKIVINEVIDFVNLCLRRIGNFNSL